MKLVFYSGGLPEENFELDQCTIKLSGKKSPKMAFIPSCSYDSEVEFYEFISQFREFGVTRFLHFPIDVPYDSIMLNEVFNSDIIHLGGGNTFYFLSFLRKNGLLKDLKKFVAKGGVLTGLSAGAIIMTPTIETAGFPDWDRDDNDVQMTNFKSMGLVKFEFFPHYRNSKRYDRDLLQYSKEIDIPLYACPDGSGIIVEDHSIKFEGPCYLFFGGKKVTINGRIPLKNYSIFQRDLVSN